MSDLYAVFAGTAFEARQIVSGLRNEGNAVVVIAAFEDIAIQAIHSDGRIDALLADLDLSRYHGLIFCSFPYARRGSSVNDRFVRAERSAATSALLQMTKLPVLNRAFIGSDTRFAEPSVQVRHLSRLGWKTPEAEVLFGKGRASEKRLVPEPGVDRVYVVMSPWDVFIYGTTAGVAAEALLDDDEFSDLVLETQRWLRRQSIDFVTIFLAVGNVTTAHGFSRNLPPQMPVADAAQLIRTCFGVRQA